MSSLYDAVSSARSINVGKVTYEKWYLILSLPNALSLCVGFIRAILGNVTHFFITWLSGIIYMRQSGLRLKKKPEARGATSNILYSLWDLNQRRSSVC
jgi:hypothetical protein